MLAHCVVPEAEDGYGGGCGEVGGDCRADVHDFNEWGQASKGVMKAFRARVLVSCKKGNVRSGGEKK